MAVCLLLNLLNGSVTCLLGTYFDPFNALNWSFSQGLVLDWAVGVLFGVYGLTSIGSLAEKISDYVDITLLFGNLFYLSHGQLSFSNL